MPTGRLAKYIKLLPQLEAQRGLDQIAQAAVGSGVMEASAQKQYLRELRRAANGGQAQVKKATMASLAQLGIPVETLPPPEKKKGGDG